MTKQEPIALTEAERQKFAAWCEQEAAECEAAASTMDGVMDDELIRRACRSLREDALSLGGVAEILLREPRP